MIDLSSEPSLGSMILTRDGDLKYSYVLPRGMTFPTGSEAKINFTDRASTAYSLGVNPDYSVGSLSDDLTTFSWVIPSTVTNPINAGDNFEVSVTLEDGTYKVRYGRVVRREVSYPLLPAVGTNLPNTYSDNMQQNAPNPKWIVKYGAVAMTNGTSVSGNPYIMGARNKLNIFGIGLSLFSSAAVAWYAPLQTDNIEITVKLAKYGSNNDGDMTVVFASDANMTKFLGIRFTDPGTYGATGLLVPDPDTIKLVTGTATTGGGAVWNSMATLNDVTSTAGGTTGTTQYTFAGGAGTGVPTTGATYKIVFTNYLNGVGTAGSPATAQPHVQVYMQTGYPYGYRAVIGKDLSGLIGTYFQTGSSAYRYMGLIFNGSAATQGPMIYDWSARDLL